MPTAWNDPSVIATFIAGAAGVIVTIGIYLHEKHKKSIAASRPSGPPVAVGVVQRGTDVIMVQRKKAENSLLWHFPAGVVKPKRTAEETIVKEIQKETGVVCKVVRQLGQRCHPNNGANLIYFHCLYESGVLANGDLEENAEVCWVPASSATERVTTDVFPAVQELLIHVANHDEYRPA